MIKPRLPDPGTAEALRENAARAREDAELVRNPKVKRSLRRSAAHFDAMAQSAEDASRPRR
jgi:hypothetical protein